MAARNPSLESLKSTQPRPVQEAKNGFTTEVIQSEYTKILCVKPAKLGTSITTWIADKASVMGDLFGANRAILFRGFHVGGLPEFESFTGHLANDFLEYSEPSTPRSRISAGTYTSTEYSANESIPMHNEHSYSTDWPTKIWFYCEVPSLEGGETPIADSREVFRLLNLDVRQRFIDRQILYTRCFHKNLDLSLEDFFQSTDKNVIESKCKAAGFAYEWDKEGGLLTKRSGIVSLNHPDTGEAVWFNQAHLFHLSNLKSEVRDYLVSSYGANRVPRNSLFGDNTNILDEDINTINETYDKVKVTFPWESGDILMLDNLLFAHGRNPYKGPRKVFVRMAGPLSVSNNS